MMLCIPSWLKKLKNRAGLCIVAIHVVDVRVL